MELRARAIVAVIGCASATAYASGEANNGFPNWQERVMHEWTNRARCAPQIEMQACGAACGEGACYTPQPPLPWAQALNHSARFHSDEMAAQSYFAHDSMCTLVSNIDSLYPGACTGAASCACVGGTETCSPTCTMWYQRVSLFGASAAGEIIAGSTDPNTAFYQWLFESYPSTACGYNQGPPTNGHRYNILMSGPAVGYGAGSGASVGDFGGTGTASQLISGSHYPQSGPSVDAWANWYASAGPMSALINVDGACTAMTLDRGSVTNGAYHVALSGLGSSCHRYFFLFHDASGTLVTYPSTGSLGIGPAGSCADWDSSRPSTGSGCACTPDCAGKQCGDDGCGGSCGNCTGGATCQVNTCIPAGADAGPIGDNADAGTAGGGGGGGKSGCCEAGGSSNAIVALGVLAAMLRSRRRR
jgi:uncharacterized protein YkwD